MNKNEIKLLAFDLDGTLSQHKTKPPRENLDMLDKLSEKYKLLMVGAGMCRRIFDQMGHYPLDILGNYGLQYAEYQKESGDIAIIEDHVLPCDRLSVDRRVTKLRQRFGYTEYAGDNTEFHASGCVTIPLLGTSAAIEEKLAFDPDRSKRRAIYEYVRALFPDYTVVVGGSSSFDMTPAPYNKQYALSTYCRQHGYSPREVVYAGDDYGPGGNDESIYASEFGFVTIDDYRDFSRRMREFL